MEHTLRTLTSYERTRFAMYEHREIETHHALLDEKFVGAYPLGLMLGLHVRVGNGRAGRSGVAIPILQDRGPA